MAELIKPIRTSITGMDGSGKSSAYRAFVAAIPKDLTVVRISRFSSVIRYGNEQVVDRAFSQALDNFHSLADRTKSKPVITLANTLCVLFSWRVQEKRLTERFNPDLVLALRDPYIDPISYAKFYSPKILGAMSIEERERTLRKLHAAPSSNNIIYLDVDPYVAVSRISQRMTEEAKAKEKAERAKWVHLHENVSDLARIRAEYKNALAYFKSKYGVEVVEIDTVQLSKAEVAAVLRSTLLKPFNGYLSTNPSKLKPALA